MTVQQLDIDDSNPELCDLICEKIASSPQQQITFAEYMELVLYHPQHGYYNSDRPNIGKDGDFITSPHWSADFAEVLGEQFVEIWQIIGKPHPFTIVEMGAGRGIFAAQLLPYLQRKYPELFDILQYIIVEISPVLQRKQQRNLVDFKNVKWCNWNEIANNSIVGCFFSNELVDALPVHQITVEQGEIKEIYVGLENSEELEKKLSEKIGEVSTPQLAKYFNLVGIDLSASAYEDGYRSEVNLAALDWIKTVAEKLQRGYVLTIDYGHPAHRYYNPRRSEGTLQCYYHHQYHSNPYINVGRQDLTAHVDFTALEKQGELCGLEVVGFTQQAWFLMALGVGDRLASLSANYGEVLDVATFLRRREALHQLLDPMGLGGFGVLVQCKALKKEEKARMLKGLREPER
jgi:SAM-dependent MidA family methyltransferase